MEGGREGRREGWRGGNDRTEGDEGEGDDVIGKVVMGETEMQVMTQ